MDTLQTQAVRPANATVAMTLLWCMAATFALIVLDLVLPLSRANPTWNILALVLAGVFMVLGVALVLTAWRAHLPQALKAFLIVSGAAGAAFLVVLALAALGGGIKLLSGVDLSPGEDGGWLGAAAFIGALMVCPALFAVGFLGTLTLLISGQARLPQGGAAQ